MSDVRRIYWLPLIVIGAAQCECAENGPDYVCERVVATFNVTGSGSASLIGADGQVISERNSWGVDIHLGRGEPAPSWVGLGWEGTPSSEGEGQKQRYSIHMSETEGLLAQAKAGDRFSTGGRGIVQLDWPIQCNAQKPSLSVDVEVESAQGDIDFIAHTVDSDYVRVFSIAFDWKDLGCGIGQARGRFTVKVTSEHFQTDCPGEFDIVDAGMVEANIVDGGLVDGGLVDGGLVDGG